MPLLDSDMKTWGIRPRSFGQSSELRSLSVAIGAESRSLSTKWCQFQAIRKMFYISSSTTSDKRSHLPPQIHLLCTSKHPLIIKVMHSAIHRSLSRKKIWCTNRLWKVAKIDSRNCWLKSTQKSISKLRRQVQPEREGETSWEQLLLIQGHLAAQVDEDHRLSIKKASSSKQICWRK